MNTKDTYSAVVESGSCSPDYERWEEIRHCGHAHRTYEAAAACLARKQRQYCQHGRPSGSRCSQCLGGMSRGGNQSADWYNGHIHNQRGERALPAGMLEAEADILEQEGRAALAALEAQDRKRYGDDNGDN